MWVGLESETLREQVCLNIPRRLCSLQTNLATMISAVNPAIAAAPFRSIFELMPACSRFDLEGASVIIEKLSLSEHLGSSVWGTAT